MNNIRKTMIVYGGNKGAEPYHNTRQSRLVEQARSDAFSNGAIKPGEPNWIPPYTCRFIHD